MTGIVARGDITWAERSTGAQRVYYDIGDDPGSPEMRSIRFHLTVLRFVVCTLRLVSYVGVYLSLRQRVGRKPKPASGADLLCCLFCSPKRHG